jgi:hypothetical protein
MERLRYTGHRSVRIQGQSNQRMTQTDPMKSRDKTSPLAQILRWLPTAEAENVVVSTVVTAHQGWHRSSRPFLLIHYARRLQWILSGLIGRSIHRKVRLRQSVRSLRVVRNAFRIKQVFAWVRRPLWVSGTWSSRRLSMARRSRRFRR